MKELYNKVEDVLYIRLAPARLCKLEIIKVYFTGKLPSDDFIRTLPGIRRSSEFNIWHIPFNRFDSQRFSSSLPPESVISGFKSLAPIRNNRATNNKEFYQIDRPRGSRTLPIILSEEEIYTILRSLKNIKHKAIIGTIYSGGLRRSELIGLRKQDVL